MFSLSHRPRRNRSKASLRDLVRETHLHAEDFVWPIFIQEGQKKRTPISSLPGVNRLSKDLALEEVKKLEQRGLRGIVLFPVVPETKKDSTAQESHNSEGLLHQTVRAIKAHCPEITVMTDVAMDPYSSDGHDGFVSEGRILNDRSLEILALQAISQAAAGADVIAPSDMMDGRVKYLRQSLDKNGFTEVGILSYAAKYASAYYGPFREALDSAPRFGDKQTYQMDPANKREALRETLLDVQEGADIVMVKPALSYLDVIHLLRSKVTLPIAAYQVSGEYSQIMAAGKSGWLDIETAMWEALLSIKRAGADLIFSYYTPKVLEKI